VSYCDRLTIKLRLLTLELRRLHLDSLLCYKIVFGLGNVFFNPALPLIPGVISASCLNLNERLATGNFLLTD